MLFPICIAISGRRRSLPEKMLIGIAGKKKDAAADAPAIALNPE